MIPQLPRRLAIIILAITATAPSHATSILPINLAQTVEHAHSAFTGTVTSVQPVHTPFGTADEVTVEVTQPVFGEGKTSQTITWRQLNRVGRVLVAGMPTFTTGSKTLVFLAGPGPGSGLRAPIGFGHGAFQIFNDTNTGIEYARNQFMNTHLMRDLDTTAIATRIAQRRLAGKPPSPAAVNAEAKAIQQSLQHRHSGATPLPSLIETTRLFHQTKQTGQKPSTHFKVSPTP